MLSWTNMTECISYKPSQDVICYALINLPSFVDSAIVTLLSETINPTIRFHRNSQQFYFSKALALVIENLIQLDETLERQCLWAVFPKPYMNYEVLLAANKSRDLNISLDEVLCSALLFSKVLWITDKQLLGFVFIVWFNML